MFRSYLYGFRHRVLSCLFVVLAGLPAIVQSQTPPALQLANTYHEAIDIQKYWISEKYDGVRAYWDGSKLISKRGVIYQAPAWFTKDFPLFPLDGELWLARNTFDQLSGIVRKTRAIDEEWRRVSYQVFDLPGSIAPFDLRLIELQEFFKQNHQPEWLQLVDQFKLVDHEALMRKLDDVVKQGGEGLMLHLGASFYHARRNDELLKLKQYYDAEARVIGHIPGKGKYQGMLGSILVETEGKAQERLRFRIGSGFSDAQRQSPPPVGALITYKYFGLTSNGVPRFASFMRTRESI